jgi:hypothetical protein
MVGELITIWVREGIAHPFLFLDKKCLIQQHPLSLPMERR